MESHIKLQLKNAGAPHDQIDKLEALHAKLQAAGLNINWQAILALIAKDGPGIVQDIITVLAQPTPAV